MAETARENPRQDIRGYAGLFSRASWPATALLVGLLSLSGIPPLAGFFGKLLLLQAALKMATPMFYILVGVAIFGVICSFYFYLGVIRTMLFTTPKEEIHPWETGRLTRWTVATLIVFVVFIGFYQQPWWTFSENAVQALLQ
jgi:NADH-quinone oxidoreductase subunit N